MGDGSKRKGNDKVRINKPKPRPSGIGGGGGGGGSGSSSERDINKVCPAAFDVQIRPKGAIKDGTSVTVRGTELFVLSESVGHLKPQHVSTIKEKKEKKKKKKKKQKKKKKKKKKKQKT